MRAGGARAQQDGENQYGKEFESVHNQRRFIVRRANRENVTNGGEKFLPEVTLSVFPGLI